MPENGATVPVADSRRRASATSRRAAAVVRSFSETMLDLAIAKSTDRAGIAGSVAETTIVAGTTRAGRAGSTGTASIVTGSRTLPALIQKPNGSSTLVQLTLLLYLSCSLGEVHMAKFDVVFRVDGFQFHDVEREAAAVAALLKGRVLDVEEVNENPSFAERLHDLDGDVENLRCDVDGLKDDMVEAVQLEKQIGGGESEKTRQWEAAIEELADIHEKLLDVEFMTVVLPP